MLSIQKISQGIRLEGLGCGLPMTFIQLGPGDSYSKVDDLTGAIYSFSKTKWVCIYGGDTTQVGMGSLVKGLSSLNVLVELECQGEHRSPGWAHQADRWVVDYVDDGLFNYFGLRTQDSIRFTATMPGELDWIQKGFDYLKLFPGLKYIRLIGSRVETLADPVFELVRKYERTRVYIL